MNELKYWCVMWNGEEFSIMKLEDVLIDNLAYLYDSRLNEAPNNYVLSIDKTKQQAIKTLERINNNYVDNWRSYEELKKKIPVGLSSESYEAEIKKIVEGLEL